MEGTPTGHEDQEGNSLLWEGPWAGAPLGLRGSVVRVPVRGLRLWWVRFIKVLICRYMEYYYIDLLLLTITI